MGLSLLMFLLLSLLLSLLLLLLLLSLMQLSWLCCVFALCCRVCCFCVVCGCFCVVVCCVLSWLFLLSLSVCVVCFTGSSYVGGGHAWARTGSLDALTSLPEHGRATSLASEALLFTSKCMWWWSAARSWPSILSGRRQSIYIRLH